MTSVLRNRSFAAIYAAETQSVVGDQLARIALAVLVFDRTGSAGATAFTYAFTYLPAILGGFVLARVGDLHSRRRVMVGCDVARAALFATMAIHGLPIVLLVCLLALAVFIGPAFSASGVSYLADRLDREQFRIGTGLRMITNQIAQVGGFALGGILVTALNPNGALVLNAATYLVSGLIIAVGLGADPRRFPPPVPVNGSRARSGPVRRPLPYRRPLPHRRPLPYARVSNPVTDAVSGPRPRPRSVAAPAVDTVVVRRLWHDHRLRALLALSSLAGLFVVPEGLAVPYAAELGATTTQAGLLLGSIPLGGALGAGLLLRLVRSRARGATANVMAILCGLPLIASTLFVPWPGTLLCWLLSGMFAAYQLEIFTELVASFPSESRARLVSVGSSVLLGAQGAGPIVFGFVAEAITAKRAIGLAGLVGSALAVVVVAAQVRSNGSRMATPATS